MIVLTNAASGVPAQTPPRQNSDRETWYEFMLKQFNPGNFDYGTWLEKRRKAFLEATVKEQYFWYSVTVTAGMLLMMAACTKLYLDHRRSMRVTAEMMADVYSHDLLSRQAATEAIEKYNQHIEQCNRAIEASEAGDARPGWGETQTDSLKAELQRVASQLEATTQDRNKLQEELAESAYRCRPFHTTRCFVKEGKWAARHRQCRRGTDVNRPQWRWRQVCRSDQPSAGRVVCRATEEQAPEGA